MSYPYSSMRFSPSAPLVPVVLAKLADVTRTDILEALIDTGADISVAPLSLLERIGASEMIETRLITQWGDVHPVTLYLVDMQVGQVHLPGVYVAGDPFAEGVVLGHNVLNKLPLFLDGPAQRTELLDEKAVKRLRRRETHP